MTDLYLSPSTWPDLTNSVNLMKLAQPGSDGVKVLLSGLDIAPPVKDQPRTISLDLFITGASANSLEQQRRDIDHLLTMAAQATGEPSGYWVGSPVTLWFRRGGPNFVFFDVMGGSLSSRKAQRNRYGQNVEWWTLSLICYPYPLGEPITLEASATLDGTNTGLYVGGVVGDEPGPCQVTVVDQCTSDAINTLWLTRHGHRYMASGDCTLLWQVAAVAPGVVQADATGINGVNVAQLTSTPNPQTIGWATGTLGKYESPLSDLWTRIKSSAAVLGTPYGLQASVVYGGAQPAGVYTLVVTALDAGAHETLPSDPISFYVGPNWLTITLTWTDQGTASNHRVYYAGAYTATASGTSTYAMTAVPATPGSPPATQDPALAAPFVRASVALSVVSPTWSNPGPAVPLVYGVIWEWVYLGRFPTPTMYQQEGAAQRASVVRIEGWTPNGGTPTLRCDGVWVAPAGRDDTQQYFEWPGLQNSTKYRYVLDTRRDGKVTGLVTNTATPPVDQGQVVPRQQFSLLPGGNTVGFRIMRKGGVADVQGGKCTLQFTYRPRYHDGIGLVS